MNGWIRLVIVVLWIGLCAGAGYQWYRAKSRAERFLNTFFLVMKDGELVIDEDILELAKFRLREGRGWMRTSFFLMFAGVVIILSPYIPDSLRVSLFIMLMYSAPITLLVSGWQKNRHDERLLNLARVNTDSPKN